MQQAHDDRGAPPPNPYAPPPVLPPDAPTKPRVWTVFSAFGAAFVVVLILNAVLMGVLVGVLLAKGGTSGLDPREIEQALFRDHGSALLAASGAISVVCLAGASFAGAWLSPVRFAERLSLRGTKPLALVLGALAPVPFGWASGALLQLVGLGDKSSSLKLITDTIRAASPASFALLTVIVALLGPFGEELMFRGYVQTRLLERFPTWTAIGISSGLFAFMHLDPVHVLGVFPIGVALGVVAARTRSLWPAVLAHVINNGVASIAGRFAGEEPGDKGSWLAFAGFAALAAALMTAFVFVTRAPENRPAS